MASHDPHPRSLDLDEVPDPDRSWVCGACGFEGDYDEVHDGDCTQSSLFDGAA